jgi:4-azaleucine resistance transporter AzlC
VRRDLREDVPAVAELAASRRRLVLDGLGIVVSIIGFGFVYGLSARSAGFSLVEAAAMSTLVFAGAAQFAAVGYVASALPWPAIALLTAFLNARHLLYSAALAPYLGRHPAPERAVAAHFLTDEAFALSVAHFRRLGRADTWGYWTAAILTVFVPWNLATLAGVALGGAVPDPNRFGLDVVFPAAMGGLAVGLVSGRRDAAAAVAGAILAVAVGLASDTSAGVVAGGLFGPFVAILLPLGSEPATEVAPASEDGAPATPDPGLEPPS